jgi:phenylpropionate dioxygenase-like ring-hydroxylating dioxygenase large terminal subunit
VDKIEFYHYQDQGFLDKERECVFATSWILFCHVSELPHLGDYLRRDLGFGQTFVVRKKEGFSAFLNFCRHRGAELIGRDEGNLGKSFIQCPYHGWKYDYEGKNLGAQKIELMAECPKQSLDLLPLEVMERFGFIFLRKLAYGESFDECVMPFREGLESENLESLVPFGDLFSGTYPVNWKLHVESYLEETHIPFMHPEYYRAITRTESPPSHKGVMRGLVYLKEHKDMSWTFKTYMKMARRLDPRSSNEVLWQYFGLFPNSGFEIFPDGLTYYISVPISPSETRIFYRAFVFPQKGLLGRMAMRMNLKVQARLSGQDEDAFFFQERGMQNAPNSSYNYEIGDTVIHEFHEDILSRIRELNA